MAVQLQPPSYPPFDCRSEGKSIRWTKWVRRLEQNVFKGCNIVDPAQQKGLLLMYGGDDLNDIVDSFDQNDLLPIEAEEGPPAVRAQTVFDRVKALLTQHFNPPTNKEFQRYVFKHTVQETDDIDDLYSELRQLAETCEFVEPNAEIKSQIISGCTLDKVRDKGLSDPNVTLEELLQYARNLQITQNHSKKIKGKTVNAVKAKGNSKPPQKQQKQTNKPKAQKSQKVTCVTTVVENGLTKEG